MVRLSIVDEEGKSLAAKDVASATELASLVEQARNLTRECERLGDQLARASGQTAVRRVPYG